MTTAAEIETALLALPPEEREPLMERVWRKHLEDPAVGPYLTPEQVALVNRRAEEVERGEVELIEMDEHLSSLSELIRRVGAGEDPELVKAELRARRKMVRPPQMERPGAV